MGNPNLPWDLIRKLLTKSVYDPDGIEGDVFDMDKMKDGTNAKVLTTAKDARLTALGTARVYQLAFENVGTATSGTLTPPANSTIVLNRFPAEADCLVTDADADSRPNWQAAYTAGGALVTGTLAANGAWTLSDTPSADTCICYAVSIAPENLAVGAAIIPGVPMGEDHGATHTNGVDDIQSATNAQKGVATAAQITALEANTSKVTNASHTGEVTGSGALTITNKAVTLAKMADMATASLLGRNTAATGVPEVLSKATALSLLNVADGADVTGDNTPKAHLLGAHTTDTLANLNSIVTDATLIDTADARLSDARTPTAHKDSHDPNDGTDALDTAAPAELAAVQAAAVGTSHSFARADHAHQIQAAITDNHIATIDGTSNQPVNTDYAKFTANGLEGRSASEAFGDIKQAATTSATGVVELAIASEVNTGTDTARAITPDALAGSVLGTKTVICKIQANDTAVPAIADGIFFFTIPEELNGMNMVTVGAHVYAASDGGTAINISVYNLTDTADMLSTQLTIDNTEKDSATATTAAVIDTGEDDVVTGDEIRIDLNQIGANATGLEVRLGFRLP